jgi:peptide/nickel transport system permease protein
VSALLEVDGRAAPIAPARRRRARPSPLIALSTAFLGLVVVCAITGTLLAPHDPSAQNLAATLQGPSASHWLGTDDSGRDVLSRIIAGARAAIIGPLAIVLGSVAIGTVLGLAAGYRGGWIDTAIMRGVDLLYALPALLVAIVLLGVLGGGYWVAVAVLVVLTAPSDTRIIRGGTLEQRTLPYVDAARTLGLSSRQVMFRHIWPNLLPLIVANVFLNFAYSLVSLSALSFLGLGVGPGAADWGRMLADNLQLIQDHPLPALAPGAALVLTATSANLLGDWCYERLSDRGRAR